jgi:hypothetical protein
LGTDDESSTVGAQAAWRKLANCCSHVETWFQLATPVWSTILRLLSGELRMASHAIKARRTRRVRNGEGELRRFEKR